MADSDLTSTRLIVVIQDEIRNNFIHMKWAKVPLSTSLPTRAQTRTVALLCEWHEAPLTSRADALEIVQADAVYSQTFTEQLKEGEHFCNQR